MSGAKATSLWLHGSSGRMGREIQKALLEGRHGFRLVGGSDRTFEGGTLLQGRPVTAEELAGALVKDKVDLVIDFSTPEANELLRAAVQKAEVPGLRVLIGTTGIATPQLKAWRDLAAGSGLVLLIAPNTSLGVLVAAKAAAQAAGPLARLGFDVEIVETHHRDKRDAPSGTAKFLAETIHAALPEKIIQTDRKGLRDAKEIGVHAVRGGGVFGEHQVRIIGDAEEIAISHRAFSRALFATGALTLAGWLMRQKPGDYGLLDVDL